MIVLREVKHKDYLKGTKALKVRHYLGAVFVAVFLLPGIPLYYRFMKERPALLEAQKKKEEARIEKAKQLFELKNMMYESSKRLDQVGTK